MLHLFFHAFPHHYPLGGETLVLFPEWWGCAWVGDIIHPPLETDTSGNIWPVSAFRMGLITQVLFGHVAVGLGDVVVPGWRRCRPVVRMSMDWVPL